MDLPVKTLQRTSMSARPSRHRASIVALAEENHVRVILDMVLNSLEEPNRLQMVRVTSPSRLRLTRPINRHILSMPFHESLPVLPIPRIIQRLHQPKILLNCQTKTSPKLPTISTNSILMRTSEFPSAGNIVLQSVFENDDNSVFRGTERL